MSICPVRSGSPSVPSAFPDRSNHVSCRGLLAPWTVRNHAARRDGDRAVEKPDGY